MFPRTQLLGRSDALSHESSTPRPYGAGSRYIVSTSTTFPSPPTRGRMERIRVRGPEGRSSVTSSSILSRPDRICNAPDGSVERLEVTDAHRFHRLSFIASHLQERLVDRQNVHLRAPDDNRDGIPQRGLPLPQIRSLAPIGRSLSSAGVPDQYQGRIGVVGTNGHQNDLRIEDCPVGPPALPCAFAGSVVYDTQDTSID